MSNNIFKKLLCLTLASAIGISINIPIATAAEEVSGDSASTPAIYGCHSNRFLTKYNPWTYESSSDIRDFGRWR